MGLWRARGGPVGPWARGGPVAGPWAREPVASRLTHLPQLVNVPRISLVARSVEILWLEATGLFTSWYESGLSEFQEGS